MVPSQRDLPYEERISKLKLPALEKRRERGDFLVQVDPPKSGIPSSGNSCNPA